jgi:hypothetical protein
LGSVDSPTNGRASIPAPATDFALLFAPALSPPSPTGEGAAVERAFRAHYDGVGGALAGLMQSKQPQERQLGQALTNLEYENLRTALKSALATQTSFFNLFNPSFNTITKGKNIIEALKFVNLFWLIKKNIARNKETKRLGSIFTLPMSG